MSAINQQLAYETRVKPRQAVLACAAALLLVGAAAIQISGPHTTVNELTLDLITSHKRFPLDLIGAIVNGAGLMALAATLVFLFRVSSVRKDNLRNYIRWLALGGAIVAALSGIAYAVIIAGQASSFVNGGAQTYQQANHLTNTPVLLALPLLGQAAALVLAVGFVLVSLNAMRVGLLTRFMGYLGIFTGVLVLFPIGSPVPVVQAFWLLALAYLLTDRWPSGVPAAWHSGQAEAWPTAAEQREARERAGRGGGAARGGGATKSPAPARPAGGGLFGLGRKQVEEETETTVVTPQAERTRSNTPKRKRKKRR
jgi:hypothetical protein